MRRVLKEACILKQSGQLFKCALDIFILKHYVQLFKYVLDIFRHAECITNVHINKYILHNKCQKKNCFKWMCTESRATNFNLQTTFFKRNVATLLFVLLL